MRAGLLVGTWLLAVVTAAGAGVGLGGCSGTGGGEIACGEQTCDASVEYCERTTDAGGAVTAACRPLPQACGFEPTCDCVLGEPCASSCSNDNGRITLECTP